MTKSILFTRVLPGLLIILAACYLWPHAVDLDAAPYCPPGWKVVSNEKQGSLRWSVWTVSAIHEWAHHPNPEYPKSMRPLNANALDYLLAHKSEIPFWWKISENGHLPMYRFDATVYETEDGYSVTRCLIYDQGWRETTQIVGFPENRKSRSTARGASSRGPDYASWNVSMSR